MFWLILSILCFFMVYCHFQNWKIVLDYSEDKERAREKGYILPAITGNMIVFTEALYLILGMLCLYKFIKPFL